MNRKEKKKRKRKKKKSSYLKERKLKISLDLHYRNKREAEYREKGANTLRRNRQFENKSGYTFFFF